MKKLEIIIRPERLDDLKVILNNNNAHGLMITNIMGYGSQKGHKQVYNGVDFGGNLLPKVKVESIVSDETYEQIIDQIIEEINTGVYGDGKIFVYEVTDAIRIRTAKPSVTAIVLSLESVFAALAGWILLGEHLSTRELTGCILVFTAVIIAQIPQFAHNVDDSKQQVIE